MFESGFKFLFALIFCFSIILSEIKNVRQLLFTLNSRIKKQLSWPSIEIKYIVFLNRSKFVLFLP